MEGFVSMAAVIVLAVSVILFLVARRLATRSLPVVRRAAFGILAAMGFVGLAVGLWLSPDSMPLFISGALAGFGGLLLLVLSGRESRPS